MYLRLKSGRGAGQQVDRGRWMGLARMILRIARSALKGTLVLAVAFNVGYARGTTAAPTEGNEAAADERLDASLQPLQELLEISEPELDLGRAKLTIDRMIDPSVDIEATIKELDRMAAQLKARIPPGASRRELAVTILSYLKEPGPWNEYRPFHYDLSDPFGKDLRSKLLPTYLSTRAGNCVSMPALFVILSQRVGLEATLATAPLHQFAKIRDDNGEALNIEATSFGTISDERYRQEYGVSDAAVRHSAYLQPWLSRRESVVVMADVLMEYYGKQREHASRIAVAQLALKAYPKSVNAMLHLASAYQNMLKERYVGRFFSAAEMTDDQVADYRRLGEAMEYWGRQAERLGWREKTAEQDSAYERNIERAKGGGRAQ